MQVCIVNMSEYCQLFATDHRGSRMICVRIQPQSNVPFGYKTITDFEDFEFSYEKWRILMKFSAIGLLYQNFSYSFNIIIELP